MLFLDLETKHLYYESAKARKTSELGISFVGVYDDKSKKYHSIWEKDFPLLEKMIKNADRVVGYNIWCFDYAALQPYMKDIDIWKTPTLDLMVAMKLAIGFRPKLDDLARANLGETKIAKGVDAVEFWKKGELKKLEEYCLEDVRLTYEVWKLGKNSKKVKYYDKGGFLKETKIDWSDGFVQKVSDNQTSMF
jgi:DEAD/DEAH box helicase domain-containing protein